MPSNRILLVEDHAPTRLVLKLLLERNGYYILTAPDLATARDMIPQGFDLLICDITLPDGNGWDLMNEISSTYPIKSIALSALGSDADIARSKASGFLDHLIKPVAPQLLLRVIEQLTTSVSATPH